ncbi:dockerin type I domain-containing protein [Candidatus Marinimicrobia bacterium]|nr:dockerin type I domain-containing protein [Candidatus Neomarinimicrobiota bacterium]
MKKILLLSLITFVFSTEVTFNVNMSDQEVGNEGPTLWMGSFYPDAGFVMSDNDGDQIWSYTIDLAPGTHTYKFRNGWWADWNTGSGWEDVPQDCEVGDYGDREVVVGSNSINIETVCFNSCSNECVEIIYSNVTFQVDMTDQELLPNDIVYVNGSFNGWCGSCNPMSDVDEDGIWELTIELGAGEYEYLYTTNGWNGLQAGAPVGSQCDYLPTDTYGNYGFILDGQDLLLDLYCFGTCYDECVDPIPVDVTFSVDMNGQTVDGNIYMIGSYQTVVPWSSFIFPTQMSDTDGDGFYTATVSLLSDNYVEYKFVNGSVIESNEGIGACGSDPNASCSNPGSSCNNRYLDVPSCVLNSNDECVLDAFEVETAIFDSCGSIAANVNFSIDLNGSGYPNADYDQCGVNGSWCATEGGDWPGFCFTLNDDDGDNIFTGTLENLSAGDYEFIVFCSGVADNYSGWGVQLGTTPGSECDFDASDEFGNYGFTVTDSDVDISYCAGSCDETCSSSDGGSDGDNNEYYVSFEIDGLDDCGFVSITGTFDNWSGWGANADNDFEAEMQNGDYEFVILCADTSIDGWYNDIWGSSTVYYAPENSDCDFILDDENPNYGFTVSNNNLTIQFCAGTCEQTCSGSGDGGGNDDGGSDTSQIDLPVNFEDSSINYTMSDFGGNVSSLVEDPEDSSNSVIQVIKTSDSETWAGTTIGTSDGFATNIPMSLSNSVMSIKVYAPSSGIPVRLKIEDSSDDNHTCETETNTSTSGWQILEFDFSNQAPGTELLSIGLDNGWVYNKASIFFNFNSVGNDETYYFDDIQMCNNGDCIQNECSANGDANQDGTVNVSDIIMVVNHIIGSSTLSGLALCASDLNGDGAINVTDIITIVNVIIGM